MRILPLLVVVGATLTGCGGGPPAAVHSGEAPKGAEAHASIERLTLSVADITYRDVRVDGTRLHGVSHEIAHFDDGYRGDSPNGYLFLSEQSPGRVSGIIDNGAITNFDYEEDRSSGRIRAHGRWAWKGFGLEVARNLITVSRDFCTDTYRRLNDASDEFVGAPDCWQAGRAGARLHVPDAFFERPAGEQVVFLTSFLM